MGAGPGLAAPSEPSAARIQVPIGEPVVVIDLGGDPAAAAKLQAGLSADSRVRIDPARATTVGQAQTALAQLDCERARALADQAALELASEHARGRAVTEDLARAYGVWLRCGTDADAEEVVVRLRQLGWGEAPPGVSDAAWSAAPAAPAGPSLAIDTEAGAQVFLDHRLIETAPLVLERPARRVVVTAVSGDRAGSAFAAADASELTIELREPVPDPSAAFRRQHLGGKSPRPSDVGELLRRSGKRVALILMPGGQVHIWALPEGTRFARRIAGAPTEQPAYVAKLVAEWTSGVDTRAPDPMIPLLREDPAKREERKKPTRWWVYVAVGAAVTVGGAIIVADSLASDRQRIELSLP